MASPRATANPRWAARAGEGGAGSIRSIRNVPEKGTADGSTGTADPLSTTTTS